MKHRGIRQARLRLMKFEGKDRPHADAFWRLYLRYVYRNEKLGMDDRKARSTASLDLMGKAIHIVVFSAEQVSPTKEVARTLTSEILKRVEQRVIDDVFTLMPTAKAIDLSELMLKLKETEADKSDDELVDDFFRTTALTFDENIKEYRRRLKQQGRNESIATLLGLEETVVEVCAVCVLLVVQLSDPESKQTLAAGLHKLFDLFRQEAEEDEETTDDEART